MRLAQQGARLYLLCRFDGYGDERCLALHRIERAEETPFVFQTSRDFDLESFNNDCRFDYDDGQRIRLRFHITAHVVDTDILDRWLRGSNAVVSDVRKRRIKQ